MGKRTSGPFPYIPRAKFDVYRSKVSSLQGQENHFWPSNKQEQSIELWDGWWSWVTQHLLLIYSVIKTLVSFLTATTDVLSVLHMSSMWKWKWNYLRMHVTQCAYVINYSWVCVTLTECVTKKRLHAHSSGGSAQGLMSEKECTKQCIDKYPACVAVDFRTSDGQCYFHGDNNNIIPNNCCNRFDITCERTQNDVINVYVLYGTPLKHVFSKPSVRWPKSVVNQRARPPFSFSALLKQHITGFRLSDAYSSI